MNNKHPLYRAYYFQKKSCAKRTDKAGNPIHMQMTFEEWLGVWEASGHIQDRGKGRGKYVMARHNDLGDYTVNNVSIVPHKYNIMEGNRGTVYSEVDVTKRQSKYLRAKSLTADQIFECHSRHQLGDSWNTIAEDYNVSADTIRQTVYKLRKNLQQNQ